MPHPLLIFSQLDYMIQIVDMYLMFTYLMTNGADPDHLASSELIWIYTVCKGRAYQGPARPGLSLCMGHS